MAVLLRAPQVYASLFETALGRAGIPAFFARGREAPGSVGPRLPGAARLRAREALGAPLRRVPVARPGAAPRSERRAAARAGKTWVAADDDELALRRLAAPSRARRDGGRRGGAGRTPDADSDSAPVLEGALRAPWKWERLLVDSAVIGGRERWSAPAGGPRRRDAPPARGARAGGAGLAARSRRSSATSRTSSTSARFALPVIDALAALPATATWGDWLGHLRRSPPPCSAGPERVLAVLAELAPLAPSGRWPSTRCATCWASELATVAERPPATPLRPVFVGTLEHARGRRVRRRVRARPGRARLSAEAARGPASSSTRSAKRLGAELTIQDDRARHERLLLRLAVGRRVPARVPVVLAHRAARGAGRASRRSTRWRCRRALAGRIPDPQTLEREAAEAGGCAAGVAGARRSRARHRPMEHDLATCARPHRPRRHRHARPRPLPARAERPARPLAAHALGALASRGSRRRRHRPARRRARATRSSPRGPTRGAYSASALQNFAACPYQFFLSAHLAAGAARGDRPARAARPAHPGQALPPRAGGVLPGRSSATAGCRSRPAPSAPALRRSTRRSTAWRRSTASSWRRRSSASGSDEIEALRVDLRTWLEQSVEGQAGGSRTPSSWRSACRRGPTCDPRSVRDEVTLGGHGGCAAHRPRRAAARRAAASASPTTRPAATAPAVGRRRQAASRSSRCSTGWPSSSSSAQPVSEARLSYCTRAGEFTERDGADGRARARAAASRCWS